MKTIYKYAVDVGSSSVYFPRGGIIVDFAEQVGDLFIWAEIDTLRGCMNKNFFVYPTGQHIDQNHKYLKTVHMKNGLVYHLYEEDL